MNRNLESYVKVYDNWLDPVICKQTVSELETSDWSQHTFYNPTDGSNLPQSGSRELDVSWARFVTTKPYLMQRAWDGYMEYVKDLNFSWFGSWQGFSEIRFNRYNEDRLMALHCDHIHSMFDGNMKGIPTMTFLAMLNSDYEGGEFIMFDDKEYEMKEGSIMIFPSCFLFPHMVKPVTRGVRYSCVSWAY